MKKWHHGDPWFSVNDIQLTVVSELMILLIELWISFEIDIQKMTYIIYVYIFPWCRMGSLHNEITYWGRVTHIRFGKLTNIGSDNGLSPGWRLAIIWTNAGILLIEPLGTNFSEILIGIQMFSFKKMCLKMSSAKWFSFCLGINVLMLNKTLQMESVQEHQHVILISEDIFSFRGLWKYLSLEYH